MGFTDCDVILEITQDPVEPPLVGKTEHIPHFGTHGDMATHVPKMVLGDFHIVIVEYIHDLAIPILPVFGEAGIFSTDDADVIPMRVGEDIGFDRIMEFPSVTIKLPTHIFTQSPGQFDHAPPIAILLHRTTRGIVAEPSAHPEREFR